MIYPDISDIFARKEEQRRVVRRRSFGEKIAMLDRMRERLAPLKRMREERQAKKRGADRIQAVRSDRSELPHRCAGLSWGAPGWRSPSLRSALE
jgi:hypothetical protein